MYGLVGGIAAAEVMLSEIGFRMCCAIFVPFIEIIFIKCLCPFSNAFLPRLFLVNCSILYLFLLYMDIAIL